MPKKSENNYFPIFVGFIIIIFILLICGCVYCNRDGFEGFGALRVTPRPRTATKPRTTPRAQTRKTTQRNTKQATRKPTQRATQRATRKPVMPRSMTILRNFFGNVDYGVTDRNYITVYSISNSPYQEWQADLLDYSFLKAKQPGSLIRLVSSDVEYPERDPPVSKVGTTISTPAYENIGSVSYKAMNKPGSLRFFMNETEIGKNLQDDDVILLVDPDMLFTKPWTPKDFKMNTVFGQKWKGYSTEFCKKTSGSSDNSNAVYCPKKETEAVMYPFAIHAKDLRKILDDYYEISRYYEKSKNWMQEMTALVLAIKKKNMKIVTKDNIGICNDWDNNNDKEAPLVHYCQTVKDSSGKEIWGKHRFKPGDSVPPSSLGLNRVDKIVLDYVKEMYYSK